MREGDEPVEGLETSTLLHAGMQGDHVETEEDHERVKASDTVDRGEEDDRAAGVAK